MTGFAVISVLVLTLHLPFTTSVQSDEGWRQVGDAWEYVNAGRVVALVRDRGTAEPGDPIAFSVRFNNSGDVAFYTEFVYLGRDDTGISIEKWDGPVPEEFQREYRGSLAANAHLSSEKVNYRAFAIVVSMTKERRSGLKRQQLRLPSPPTDLAIEPGLGVPMGRLEVKSGPGSTTLRTVFNPAPER